MKEKTVGSYAYDLLNKPPDTQDPIELQREMQKDYEDNFWQTVDRGKKDKVMPDVFYVVVETKRERLLTNVIRNYFLYRASCPTPNYDQTVYKIDTKHDRIEFIWVVPSKDTCELFLSNKQDIAHDEQGLLKYIQAFADGTLLLIAKKMNHEEV